VGPAFEYSWWWGKRDRNLICNNTVQSMDGITSGRALGWPRKCPFVELSESSGLTRWTLAG